MAGTGSQDSSGVRIQLTDPASRGGDREDGKAEGKQDRKNLLAAFAGESQARNRYTYFAGGRARRRASRRSPTSSRRPPTRRRSTPSGFFKFLEGGEVEVTAASRPA